ncbi:MAG: SIS domain-containing protein [Aliivibrio sp.]|uniref:SIS domain-containing protein n=1 Tax=Aliivibrio sp. TaxID=1872443 RepID=UPI001A60A1CB|nr:SIS domain-containing protein [Aliivibrio sp.]
MNHFLGYSESTLKKESAYWTAKEITQQPSSWRKTAAIIDECSTAIDAFLEIIYGHENLRIILTGAGTSAFAGVSIAPALTSILKRRVEAIATTDIVSNPGQYFAEDIPTLVVSFARSGNSPESVAAVDLANQCLSNCFHLVLTCNSGGELYRRCANDANSLVLLMPEETNDKSFAMTSSFSSMLLASFSILTRKNKHSKDIESICKCSESLLKEINTNIVDTAKHDFSRVIYLGSGGMQGLARESALKLLELTAGKVIACYDSPLGFRHGPKSIVNDKTFIVVFISNNAYTRQYDLDLLVELRRDNRASKVLAITAQIDDRVVDGDFIHVPNMEIASDVELLFPYMLFAQIYSFHRALELGNTPDNPCPSGEVNRVVQGVTVHKFENIKKVG